MKDMAMDETALFLLLHALCKILNEFSLFQKVEIAITVYILLGVFPVEMSNLNLT